MIQYHLRILFKWKSFFISGAKKPYTDNKGKSDLSDRLVAVQPLMFDKMYNLRKMMELPHHLVAADMLTELKEHVLCNIDWLLAKLKATSYRFGDTWYDTLIFWIIGAILSLH